MLFFSRHSELCSIFHVVHIDLRLSFCLFFLGLQSSFSDNHIEYDENNDKESKDVSVVARKDLNLHDTYYDRNSRLLPRAHWHILASFTTAVSSVEDRWKSIADDPIGEFGEIHDVLFEKKVGPAEGLKSENLCS